MPLPLPLPPKPRPPQIGNQEKIAEVNTIEAEDRIRGLEHVIADLEGRLGTLVRVRSPRAPSPVAPGGPRVVSRQRDPQHWRPPRSRWSVCVGVERRDCTVQGIWGAIPLHGNTGKDGVSWCHGVICQVPPPQEQLPAVPAGPEQHNTAASAMPCRAAHVPPPPPARSLPKAARLRQSQAGHTARW